MVRWMSGLVTGLQNQLHPFESGTHLLKKVLQLKDFFLLLQFKYFTAFAILILRLFLVFFSCISNLLGKILLVYYFFYTFAQIL